MQTIVRHRSTVEYLTYTFDSVTVDGETVDPPTTYQLAAPLAGQQPDEWHDGPWLAGPLEPGLYALFVRFTDSPEVPVRHVGWLTVS